MHDAAVESGTTSRRLEIAARSAASGRQKYAHDLDNALFAPMHANMTTIAYGATPATPATPWRNASLHHHPSSSLSPQLTPAKTQSRTTTFGIPTLNHILLSHPLFSSLLKSPRAAMSSLSLSHCVTTPLSSPASSGNADLAKLRSTGEPDGHRMT
ncbi:hypothetical protein BP00DRAFT_76926 [Aspergillus indologenus CBS 114.80]|uniref:Uncharacterized protein n=1 Tax=Aspergillus indologenus CBS 114.80 TaxID=1450541 RepID=A0A2V5IQ61_9EURO|nr:hypothetical protein BP00DRAFT_76926 [Aspergillus indologenus CBS 114.80]